MTSTPSANTGATIMVVDDTPANLQLLTGLLQSRGYRVRPVPSGELALEAFRREVPELVLLDINMPGMTGYEVCERFKRDPLAAAVPVIFLSALSETTDKVKGFALGAVDYITKPFQFAEVESRVSTHLELARLRQQLERHNAQLEELVRQRTARLAEAHARLAILDKAKSDFLTLISHELRTPLCGVFGVVELMLHETSDREKKEEYTEIYQRSRCRLLTLIDDALLLSEIDTGSHRRKCEECSLDRLLEQAWSQAEPVLGFRQVHADPLPTDLGSVCGSPDHFVRALRSLLETAVTFARTWTTLRLTRLPSVSGTGLVIEADGTAIPQELLPRFFDLLAIAQPITPGGDLGVAPALAERIVSLYGGTVSVENLTPPGVRFTVRFPAPEPACV